MNIDQLLKDKTQILRNDQGKIVNGIAVEDLEAVINEIKAVGIDDAVDACPMETCFGNTPFTYIEVKHLLEYATNLRQQNKDELCNYPECNCPFDMGSDNKCAKGLKNKEQ